VEVIAHGNRGRVGRTEYDLNMVSGFPPPPLSLSLQRDNVLSRESASSLEALTTPLYSLVLSALVLVCNMSHIGKLPSKIAFRVAVHDSA
jgi:hypothetical protein